MTAKVLLQVIQRLKSARTSMRCAELGKLLESLGFYVKDGERGGHKVFFHDHLEGFISSSYDCGHGRNPEIKPAYISNVLRTLRQYEAELTRYLESDND